jgi:hypothetical protein
MMTATDETPRVWLGCLACYNAGFLIGEWYAVEDAADLTTKELHAPHNITTDDAGNIKGAEIYGPHEELWVMDHENTGMTGEFGPLTCRAIADAFEVIGADMWPAYLAYCQTGMGSIDGDGVTDPSGFEESYAGEWDSWRAYADEQASEMIEGMAVKSTHGVYDPREKRAAREAIEWLSGYFDWEGYARDLEMEYTHMPAPGGGVYVFRSV